MASSSIYALASLVALLATEVSGASTKHASTAENVAVCCQKLHDAYPDQVVLSGNSSYESWNGRWADTAELSPSCIFRPQSADDVSFAVKTFAAGAGGCNDFCPFSIKGGGHTPWAGANNVDDGIAIDLDTMNQIILSEDRSYARLGGGAIWHDVYSQTDGQGVAFPGGRCPGTGVGGVTLGGGYSWFTGSVGFSADSVRNYEVVLASGEIVNANATSNTDLFKALKGGNNNFGVVTRFDVNAIPHSQQVYGGLVIVPTSVSDDVITHLHNFTDDSTGVHTNVGLQIEYFLDSPEGDGQILLWLIDTDATGDHGPLQPFFEMEPKLLNQVYSTSIADYPTSIPAVSRVLMADATFVNDLETIKGIYNLTREIHRTLAHVPDLIWDFQFEPLPRHVIDASNARGGNSLGLEDIEEDLMIVFIMPLWQDAAYDKDVHEASEAWYKAVHEYTQKRGKGHRFEFANYAAWFQDPMASYGPESLKFLQTVSRKYDPGRLFQKAVKGGYKVGL